MFNYRNFKLTNLEQKNNFICFELRNEQNYKLQGCTKRDWQEYAKEVVNNYYDELADYRLDMMWQQESQYI